MHPHHPLNLPLSDITAPLMLDAYGLTFLRLEDPAECLILPVTEGMQQHGSIGAEGAAEEDVEPALLRSATLEGDAGIFGAPVLDNVFGICGKSLAQGRGQWRCCVMGILIESLTRTHVRAHLVLFFCIEEL